VDVCAGGGLFASLLSPPYGATTSRG